MAIPYSYCQRLMVHLGRTIGVQFNETSLNWKGINLIWVIGIGVGAIVWRVSCRYVSVPWPSWLAWFLENPYMKIFCHPDWVLAPFQETGPRVLEIGCGAGRIGGPLIRRLPAGGSYTGVDLQHGMIRQFNQREEASLSNVELIQSDIENFMPDELYDLVVMATVLGEVPERVKLSERVFAWLKPGGEWLVTEVLPDACYVGSGRCIRLAEEAGFKVKSIRHNAVAYTAVFAKSSPKD